MRKLVVGPHTYTVATGVSPVRKLLIGPHTYTVAFVPSVADAVHRQEGTARDADENLYGHINNKLGMIHVGLDMRGTQQADSLLHETLHAILTQLGADDERFVHALTPALLALLRRNPWFTEFLMEAKA